MLAISLFGQQEVTKSNVSNYIENGDFETGDFTGWTLMDGTMIGSYRQSRFNDSEFPYVGKGSWADMGRYFVNLSDYIGEPLYIELSDSKINGPWASAFVCTYFILWCPHRGIPPEDI